MAIFQQVSPTKRAKIRPARLGVGGNDSFTYTWLPRPASWPGAGQTTVGRNATGVNKYMYMLSQRHTGDIRCGVHASLALPLPHGVHLLCL